MIVPDKEIEILSPIVKEMFLKWRDFLYNKIKFNMPDSEIHAAAHCERVLLYALIMGHDILGDNRYSLSALAHAAVFHDSCRQDDYLDPGHGARAAVYYKRFCDESPDVEFIPEAQMMIEYHDIENKRWKLNIKREIKGEPRIIKLYDIFKDADALDRCRLGDDGLDPAYLRTEQAKTMVDYSHRIVRETMSENQRRQVKELFSSTNRQNKTDTR